VHFFRYGASAVVIALCLQVSLPAQTRSIAGREQEVSASIPFVGCKSFGQTGPIEAPKGASKVLLGSRLATQQLAYYKSNQGVGVLAPRDWYCFQWGGSGGETLIVSRQPIDERPSADIGDLSGPMIVVAYRFGDTSGRWEVADVIARVFPTYKGFVTTVMKEWPGGPTFVFRPYTKDSMIYRSKSSVEYRTPAQTDGLGTLSWLRKGDDAIEGAAILVGRTPDLVLLSVRLPADLKELKTAIVREVEHESPRCPCN
jgi:hypothetical protein